jgi:hypothetical protein
MANVKIERLEQAFRYWENACLICYASYMQGLSEVSMANKNIPCSFENAPQFREYLVDSFGQKLDYEKFVTAPVGKLNLQDSSFAEFFPIAMHAWVNKSRRVYHISEEFGALLENISLKGIYWSDIHLPFDSFVLTMETPLASFDGPGRCDCLVTFRMEHEGANYLCATMLDSQLESYSPFSGEQTAKINWAIKKQRWNKVRQKIKSSAPFSEVAFIRTAWLKEDELKNYDQDLETLLSEGAELIQAGEKTIKNMNNPALAWLRMLAGFSLFLQTKPPAIYEKIVPPQTSAKSQNRLGDGKSNDSITYGCEICTLLTSHVLTSEESRAIKLAAGTETGRRMPTHFRAGHWRRPPGRGNDPSYPKTVLVKPSVINAHLRPDGALPEGSEQIL